ncbi:MAG: hypothetical protein ACLPKB_32850 [Xanthobacteraceae bacterium]
MSIVPTLTAEGSTRAPIDLVEPPSLAAKIIAAHEAAVAAQLDGYKTSLQHAIKAGELLNQAKADANGKWSDWLTDNCPKIPQTTATLYMRLAKNKDKLAQIENQQRVANLGNDGKLSIRSANSLLTKKGSRKGRTPKTTNNNHDKSALEKALEALAPDELSLTLREVFEPEELNTLGRLITKHLDEAEHA